MAEDWVGTKPPVPCNKLFGICGYINCRAEGRCLQAPHTKPRPREGKE